MSPSPPGLMRGDDHKIAMLLTMQQKELSDGRVSGKDSLLAQERANGTEDYEKLTNKIETKESTLKKGITSILETANKLALVLNFIGKIKQYSSYIRFTQIKRPLLDTIDDAAFDFNFFFY